MLPIRYLVVTLLFLVHEHGFAKSAKLTWTGCDISRKAFMEKVSKIYEKKFGVEIKLNGGGSTKGIKSSVDGHTDMGGACRYTLPSLRNEQEEKARMTIVAWDAMVPIVHPSNPIKSLTLDQIKAILEGKISNWKELGGKDQKIELLVRKGKISGIGLTVREFLFGITEEKLKKGEDVKFSKNAKVHRTSKPLEKEMEKNPLAFAVTGVSSARKRNVKILDVGNFSPSMENIATGDYPLFRPLYLVTNGEPEGETAKFISWLLSDEGQELIEKENTVSVRKAKGVLKDKFKFWPKHTDRIINFSSL